MLVFTDLVMLSRIFSNCDCADGCLEINAAQASAYICVRISAHVYRLGAVLPGIIKLYCYIATSI